MSPRQEWNRNREIEFRALLEVKRQPLTLALQALQEILRWSDIELTDWYMSRRLDFSQLLECQTFKWLASSMLEPSMLPEASYLPWMPCLDSALRLEFPMNSHWVGDDTDGQSSLPIPTDLFINELMSNDSTPDLNLFEQDVLQQQDDFFDELLLEKTLEEQMFDLSWF
jgi:hypothetical protein